MKDKLLIHIDGELGCQRFLCGEFSPIWRKFFQEKKFVEYSIFFFQK